jgi:hypothetical protein
MKKQREILAFVFFALCATFSSAQDSNTGGFTTAEASAKSDAESMSKASGWVAALSLNDNAKEQKVKTAVATHLKSVRDWHNDHPASSVPPGINPATGNRLSEMDRDIIANSAMPKSIHDSLMDVLKQELTPEQLEAVLDKYTIGKVAFTLQGYKAIVPDLKPEEETQILVYLKQAREQAIDFKNMKEISAIFEIYKTKCEQYLNSNGRDWRRLYKAYTDDVKAKKAAKKQKESN